MSVQLDKDLSYAKILSSELVGDLPNVTPEQVDGKETILVVDTSRWFEWHVGSRTWYEQI